MLGVLAVTKTLKVTLCRTCRVHNSFQFQRCDNILGLVISVFVVVIKLYCVKACCNNDCAVLFCYDFVYLVVIDSACLTNLFTKTALACLELDAGITVNYGNIGNSLSKGSVDSTAIVKTTVEFARCLLGRTLFLTNTAACTFVHIYASCFLSYIYCEITNEACYLVNLAVCVDVNLFVSCSLNHFRCEDTSGTVKCGEGLIKLAHSAADGRSLLNNVNLVACICNVESCLDTCNTATDNKCTLCNAAFTGEQGRIEVNLCNSCSGKNNCLFGSFFHILMNPGAVLTDVCNFNHVGVKTCSFSSLTECTLVHSGRTGANYDTGKILFLNSIQYFCLTCLGAHVLIILAMYNTGLL